MGSDFDLKLAVQHFWILSGESFKFPFLSRVKGYFCDMKVLVIEDEKALSDTLKISLEKEFYLVEVAGTFHDALEKMKPLKHILNGIAKCEIFDEGSFALLLVDS